MFSSEIDTIIGLAGLIVLLAGLYLWLGLAASLITLGLVMIAIGYRLDPAEFWSKYGPHQKSDT